MYRVYDEFERCFYTLKEAEQIKKDNPTAPPERWLFVTICDEMPNDVVREDMVVIQPEAPWLDLHLGFAYSLEELRLSKRSVWQARSEHAKKHGVQIRGINSVAANKKTLELALGCQLL
ncbi:hypothetical protein [Phascolarctobacterium succinatutens]|uniref:hypothetical protein n=1 Tax=Phascolarctobacterium succinatutens TaxID=626940 RepID=UPI003AB2E961